MKAKAKIEKSNKDDSLFGLLSSYKQFNSYVRVFDDEEHDEIILAITSNPKFWKNMPESYLSLKELKRLELGVDKLSIKYVEPSHILKTLGPSLGLKIGSDKLTTDDSLKEKGYYCIKISRKSMPKVIKGVKQLINMSPQKKYEILEKSLFSE